MTNPIITLSCPSCGGKLQISKNVNRFACGYCGNEHIVHRESGIVYLEPIAEDIHHIRGGVDKTAAELAIARLTGELKELENELQIATPPEWHKWQPKTNIEILITIIAAIALLFVLANRNIASWSIFLVFLSWFLFLRTRRKSTARTMRQDAIDDIQEDIENTREALIRNRKLV